MSDIDLKEFKYLEDYDLEVPSLVLAVVAKRGDYKIDYEFKDGRKFFKLVHQCSGLACNHLYIYATMLEPTDVSVKIMKRLDRMYLDSNLGVLGNPSIDELVEYRDFLKDFGLDCNYSYSDFMEAVYPIDLSAESLKIVCKDQLPEDLDDLIDFKDNWHKFCGIIGRWNLFILGNNCD